MKVNSILNIKCYGFSILLKIFIFKVCSVIYNLNGGFIGNVGETPYTGQIDGQVGSGTRKAVEKYLKDKTYTNKNLDKVLKKNGFVL